MEADFERKGEVKDDFRMFGLNMNANKKRDHAYVYQNFSVVMPY